MENLMGGTPPVRPLREISCLRKKELCEKTGAGRNTVREALKILASRKYIGNSTGGRDFCVRETGVADDPLGFRWLRIM